ncbi:MAG: GNAT family N-acetyltransferase [Solirubrobacteraceae bacterium]
MFELRAFDRADEPAVLRSLEARDRADFGDPVIRREVPLGEWRDREFDPANAVVAVLGGEVVGYAVLDAHGGFSFLDPAHEDPGIEAELVAWVERRAREMGRRTCQQLIAGGDAGAQATLTDAGYERARSLLLMDIELARAPAPPAPPDGITLAPLEIERDGEAVYAADAEAFAADPAFIPTPWPSFHDREFADPELVPALSRVARRGAAIAGYATCRRQTNQRGYVEILGVVEAERRRGLGRTLLLAVFDAFAAAGLTRGRLMVASDNPRARALYESVGMAPVHELVVLERTL